MNPLWAGMLVWEAGWAGGCGIGVALLEVGEGEGVVMGQGEVVVGPLVDTRPDT